MLNTYESLFLLALNDEEGEISKSVKKGMSSAFAGAVIAEMVMKNLISLEDHHITVTDQVTSDDRIQALVIKNIYQTAKPRKPKYWINTLVFKNILNETAHSLVEKGVLIRKNKGIHLVSPDNVNQVPDTSTKYGLKNHLRDIVLTGKDPGYPELILLAFLFRARLLKLVFTLDERKTARKRIYKFLSNGDTANRLGESLDEILSAACE